MPSMNTKYYSDLQEKLVAKTLGWSQVTGSGSRATHPGDVKGDGWLGECKTYTKHHSKIVFKYDVWEKVQAEAMSQFARPAYFTDTGTQKLEDTWVLFSDIFDLGSSITRYKYIYLGDNSNKNISFDPNVLCNSYDITSSSFVFYSHILTSPVAITTLSCFSEFYWRI